jgi:hypothetical protein
MAAAIDAWGIGASGSQASGSTTDAELESTAFASPADGFAAASARRLNADISNTANAAVAIILKFDLIVASRTARRDHPSISSPHEPGANGTSRTPYCLKNG